MRQHIRSDLQIQVCLFLCLNNFFFIWLQPLSHADYKLVHVGNIFFFYFFIDFQSFMFLVKEKTLGYSVNIFPRGLAIFIHDIFFVDYLKFLPFIHRGLC